MMKPKKLEKSNNINELQTTTSTYLQDDVGDTDTSLYKNKQTNIELIEYKIEELNKKVIELDNQVKEINMPLIDKINKYKTVVSWIAGIITTISIILFNLYNNSIQTHFASIEQKIVELSTNEKELKTDIKELKEKLNSLEIKIIENKKK